MHDHQINTHLFGWISFGSLWSALVQFRALGPSWSVVPPLLVGLAGFVGAVNAALNDRHRRACERADRELERQGRRAFSFDQLEGGRN